MIIAVIDSLPLFTAIITYHPHQHHHQVGISDWGKYGENGAETQNPSFPYRQDICLETHHKHLKLQDAP